MRTNKYVLTNFLFVLVGTLFIAGCYQGRPSKKEPIHLNPNMDNQEKYRPQEESRYFVDGATMRVPVEGTVARGELREDTEYYTGKTDNGEFIKTIPLRVPYNMQLIERGQKRYDIYCSPCHGRIGNGRGIIVERGMVPPPTFHSDSIRAYPDGRIFDVITNGIRNMPAYKYQVPVEDRWAIIAYFRVLQRSQYAPIEDAPEAVRNEM